MGLRRRPAPLARDAALARLRRLTIVATAVGTALAGGFAALAANAVPGRKAGGATSPATTRPASGGGLRLQPARPRTTTTAPAPSSDDAPAPATTQAPAPSPPSAPPAPAPAPPVVVSGGS